VLISSCDNLLSWQRFIEITLVSSAYNFVSLIIFLLKLFIKITNKRGPSTDPWGTPLVTFFQLEIFSPITTRWTLFYKKALHHFNMNDTKPKPSNFFNNLMWETGEWLIGTQILVNFTQKKINDTQKKINDTQKWLC
jgi:hypothetical protein